MVTKEEIKIKGKKGSLVFISFFGSFVLYTILAHGFMHQEENG